MELLTRAYIKQTVFNVKRLGMDMPFTEKALKEKSGIKDLNYAFETDRLIIHGAVNDILLLLG